MNQDLKKKRRYELLNYEKKLHYKFLTQQGIDLNDEVNSRLRTYSIILIDHLNWEIRDQYLELLDKFIDKKIDSFNFRIAFCERYESIEKVADLLKSNRVLLSPDQNSLEFGDLLAKIDDCCKAYCDDPEPFRNKFEIGDAEFTILMEEIYFQMKDFLNEE